TSVRLVPAGVTQLLASVRGGGLCFLPLPAEGEGGEGRERGPSRVRGRLLDPCGCSPHPVCSASPRKPPSPSAEGAKTEVATPQTQPVDRPRPLSATNTIADNTLPFPHRLFPGERLGSAPADTIVSFYPCASCPRGCIIGRFLIVFSPGRKKVRPIRPSGESGEITPFEGATMTTISRTLLARLRTPVRDDQAWGRLLELYGPVVYGRCRKVGIPAQDVP